MKCLAYSLQFPRSHPPATLSPQATHFRSGCLMEAYPLSLSTNADLSKGLPGLATNGMDFFVYDGHDTFYRRDVVEAASGSAALAIGPCEPGGAPAEVAGRLFYRPHGCPEGELGSIEVKGDSLQKGPPVHTVSWPGEPKVRHLKTHRTWPPKP